MADTVSFLHQSCCDDQDNQSQDEDQDTKPVSRLSRGKSLSRDLTSLGPGLPFFSLDAV